MSNLGLLCFAHHVLHHDGKLEITGTPGKLTFRRILDHVDSVEDLGEYEMIDIVQIHETNGDFDSDPRGTESDFRESVHTTDHLAIRIQ